MHLREISTVFAKLKKEILNKEVSLKIMVFDSMKVR